MIESLSNAYTQSGGNGWLFVEFVGLSLGAAVVIFAALFLPLLITRKRSQDLNQPFRRRVRWWLYLVTIPAAAVIAVPGISHIQQFEEQRDQLAEDTLSREEAEATSLDEFRQRYGDVSLYRCEDLDVMDGCSPVETWTAIDDWYGAGETKALAIRTEDSPPVPGYLMRGDSADEDVSHTVTLMTTDGEYAPDEPR